MNIGKINDIEYLNLGNSRQRKSYRILKENRVMENLKGYDPNEGLLELEGYSNEEIKKILGKME